VDVVEQPFHRRVVDGEHRVLEFAVGVHRAQAVDARRRLLAAADDTVDEFGVVLVDRGDQIHPVVHSNRGFVLDDGLDGGVVLVVVDAAFGVGSDAVDGVERDAHVVVGREGVTTGDGYLGAGGGDGLGQDGGLGLDVHRHADGLAGERLLALEVFAERFEDGHVLARPVHLATAGFALGVGVVDPRRDRFGHTPTEGERTKNPTGSGPRDRVRD